MDTRPKTQLIKTSERFPSPAGLSELVMAWAVDCESEEPRYILQLDALHRGAKSNCKCPSCGLSVQAVNAAKAQFKKRPHFRHPKGAIKEQCLIIAARRALEAAFLKQEQIVLPRRRRSKEVEGLSGHYFDAWVENQPERLRLANCHFHDEATAVLTFDDGRRLFVNLVGSSGTPAFDNIEESIARIELHADDPSIAMMSPEEIFSRLELCWSTACWISHWDDAALDHEATENARQKAIAALDWLDDSTIPQELTATERRETLLHREVKAILEREKRIKLPGLNVTVAQVTNGRANSRTWSQPETEVILTNVYLETPIGTNIPDVVAEWVNDDGWSKTMLIEVTVTNTMTDERIERLSSYGFPVLEIDIGRMGGTVTIEEFTRLVVDEVAGKTWLYHPEEEEERQHLLRLIEDDERKRKALDDERRRKALDEEQNKKALNDERVAILKIPEDEWASRYLTAFTKTWIKKSADDEEDEIEQNESRAEKEKAGNALAIHGHSIALGLGKNPLWTIVARLLSIQKDIGIGYDFENGGGVVNAIHCDRSRSLQWHTLYLIAVRIYRPTLTDRQQENCRIWRKKVKDSLTEGEKIYERDTRYDQLLSVFFPEMREALKKSFGTARNDEVDVNAIAKRNGASSSKSNPDPNYLHGKELDDWAVRNPVAAAAWFASPAGQGHR